MINARQLFDDLTRTKALLWTGIDRHLVAAGVVNLASLSMLGAIESRGRCRVQDLAIETVITTGGASQAVDRLVRLGLCRRTNNPDDRRSSLVELTAEGRAALEAGDAVFNTVLLRYLEPLDAEQQDALGHALREIRVHATTVE